MTLKKAVPQRKPDYSARVTEAQAALNATANRWEAMPYGPWLRAMAEQRRTLAALYRAASHAVDTDSAEWHAFMDAALMLDMHAVANETSAAEHETNHLAVVGGAQ